MDITHRDEQVTTTQRIITLKMTKEVAENLANLIDDELVWEVVSKRYGVPSGTFEMLYNALKGETK
jgi:hypothetical protein